MLRRHGVAFLGAFVCLSAGGQTVVDLARQGRNADFSQQASTRPIPVGTVLPGSCQVGALYFKSNALPGLNLYSCTAVNTWTLMGPVTSVFGRTGAVGKQRGDYDFSDLNGVAQVSQGGTGAAAASAARENLGAAAASHGHAVTDLNGITSQHGNGAQLQAYAGGAAQAGHCAQFDAAGNLVSAGAPCVPGPANYGAAFSGQTAVTLAHGLNTLNVIAQCYDGTGQALGYNTLSVIDANTAVVTFQEAQSGRCVVNGSGGSGGAGLLAVSSVFGRIGAVAAQAGDYTFAQLGGTLQPAQVAESSRQGNGTKIQMYGGGMALAGDCASFDAAGNVVSAGAPCGAGGGGSGGTYTAGAGIMITNGAIGVDSASVPTYLTLTASLADWNNGADNIPAQSCQEKSFPFPGAMTSDGVAPRWPTTLPLPLTGIVYISAGGVMTVRLCNPPARAS
jgi:hypothetical protein